MNSYAASFAGVGSGSEAICESSALKWSAQQYVRSQSDDRFTERQYEIFVSSIR